MVVICPSRTFLLIDCSSHHHIIGSRGRPVDWFGQNRLINQVLAFSCLRVSLLCYEIYSQSTSNHCWPSLDLAASSVFTGRISSCSRGTRSIQFVDLNVSFWLMMEVLLASTTCCCSSSVQQDGLHANENTLQ